LKKHLFDKAGVVSAAIVVMCALSACSLPFSKGDDSSLLSQGMQKLEEGSFEEARALFEQAADNDEDIKESLRGLGMAELAAGNYDAAQNHFKEALSKSNGIIDDIDIDISYYLAVAKYRGGDCTGAIDTYNSIIAINPDEDNAYYMRGKAYLMQGDKEAALSDYEMAVTLEPEDYDHYLRICEDLREAGYKSEGDGYIRRAMEADGKLSEYQLGVFNYYLGNYTEARNNLENAREDSKSGPDLIMYLGRTYEELGDTGYAISLYEGYIAEGGAESAGAYDRIGLAKMNQKDYEGALSAFESGISLGGGAYLQSLLYNRIVAYEYLNDFENAKNLMAEYVVKYPGDEKAARENIFLSTR